MAKEKQSTDILVLRDQAKNQLQQIRTVEDGISYLNKLKSIDIWVKAEKKDAELQNIVAEQKLRTQRILGELLQEEKRKGLLAQPADFLKEGPVVPEGNHGKNTLNDYGLTKKQSATFQQIAEIPQEQFEEFIQDKKQAVDDAVAELTTAGALRLARSLHDTPDETPAESTELESNPEKEVKELADHINKSFTIEQRSLLITLIKIKE